MAHTHGYAARQLWWRLREGWRQHFLRLLALDPAEYAKWEWNERRLREQLGDVAILRDRKGDRTRPLTLRELREANTVQGVLFDYGGAEDDWGGCNCMTPAEDDAT